MHERIEIVPYNYSWPSMFDGEAMKIGKALGNNCIKIHHIGSTSIVGLGAKPIIDMLPVVLDITAVDDSAIFNMTTLGYEAKGTYGIPFRRYFQKSTNAESYNIHIFEKDNSQIEYHLKFRNWMRMHETDRWLYENLKKQLADQFLNDRLSYCLGKYDFITAIHAKAGWEGIRIVFPSTSKEWDAYHRIKKTQIFDLICRDYDSKHPSLTADNHFHFVLYKGIQIVSIAHVEFLNDHEATLRSIAADEGYKNQGLGETLMRLIKKWAQQQKVTTFRTQEALKADRI
jgi:GrpB-like predicted nucleotidyltransferase (UPF0157 family)